MIPQLTPVEANYIFCLAVAGAVRDAVMMRFGRTFLGWPASRPPFTLDGPVLPGHGEWLAQQPELADLTALDAARVLQVHTNVKLVSEEGYREHDDLAQISLALAAHDLDPGGAYVASWTWYEHSFCRTCGAPYSPNGDGWDGECPNCADRTSAAEDEESS